MSRLEISPYPYCFLYTVVIEPPGFVLQGMSGGVLPGVEPVKRSFYADKRAPEELAAFYDDLRNESRINDQLFNLYLEGVTSVQTTLFE